MDVRSYVHGGCMAAVLALAAGIHMAQAQQDGTAGRASGTAPGAAPGNPMASKEPAGEILGRLLQVPVTNLLPGGASPPPPISIPAIEDPAAAERGMRDFIAFNCVGCHMPNGGGGMGPALSNRQFIYGSSPENIYLTIVQGRPNGMPSWGKVLPNEVIWDLVAYVRSISNPPNTEWGTTVSPDSPAVQQVPAELQQSATPWKYTERFTKGQKP